VGGRTATAIATDLVAGVAGGGEAVDQAATTAAGAVIGSAIPVIGTVPNGEERLIPTWLAEYIDYAHSMCLSVDTLLWVYRQSSSQPCISRLPRRACA
jgi:hypothetical protein